MDRTDLQAHVAALRAANPARIQHFRFEGRSYWLKQTEKPRPRVVDSMGSLLTLLVRNPLYVPARAQGVQALEDELRRLGRVADKGMPVARVILRGSGWFVMPDLGFSIRQILDSPESSHRLKRQVLVAAAESLALMHVRGIWHGKPTLRDMIWDGEQIWYVDFEEDPGAYFSPAQCQVRDLMFFVYSLFRYLEPGDTLLEDIAVNYREKAPAEIWEGACRQARRMPIVYAFCTLLSGLKIRDLVQTRNMLRLFRTDIRNEGLEI